MIRGLATAAVAALVLPLVAGCSVLPGSKATAAPGSTAAPSAMPAGTHTTAAFQPATTYTVGTGWAVATDTASYFNLIPVTDPNNSLHLFHNAQALSQAPSCPTEAQPGVGTSSLELVTWIRSLKGLSVTPPTLATLDGLPATSIDVSIAPGWTQSCPFANGIPTVPLFYGKDQSLRWVVASPERLRLYFVDVPNLGTVVVDLDSFDGTGFEGLIASASPIVKSLAFAR